MQGGTAVLQAVMECVLLMTHDRLVTWGSIHCHMCQIFDAHTCRWPSTCGILSSWSPSGLWQRKVRLVELRTILHCSLSIYMPQTNIQTMDRPGSAWEKTGCDESNVPPVDDWLYTDWAAKIENAVTSAWRFQPLLRTGSLLTQHSCWRSFP